MFQRVTRRAFYFPKRFQIQAAFFSGHASDISKDLQLTASPLQESDPQLYKIIENEKKRQRESIVLIPSENYTSKSVLEALGSVMQNKYSEGYPGNIHTHKHSNHTNKKKTKNKKK